MEADMKFDDHKVVLYRNEPDGWVAEIPALSGCYAPMPTRDQASIEVERVFETISAEYGDKGQPLPADTLSSASAPRGR